MIIIQLIWYHFKNTSTNAIIGETNMAKNVLIGSVAVLGLAAGIAVLTHYLREFADYVVDVDHFYY